MLPDHTEKYYRSYESLTDNSKNESEIEEVEVAPEDCQFYVFGKKSQNELEGMILIDEK